MLIAQLKVMVEEAAWIISQEIAEALNISSGGE